MSEPSATSRLLGLLHRVQRVTLALWGVTAGALALAGLILPAATAQHVLGRALSSPAVVASSRADGARLGLAVIALVAAFAPKPPRALVWALFVSLTASSLALLYVRALGAASVPDVTAYTRLVLFDGAIALVLLVTQELRALLVRRQARS